jgi:hypothetical protein
MQTMLKRWQFITRIAGFFLGLAAFVLAVYSIPLSEIWSVMRASFNRYLVLCVFFWIFSIVFQAWRWHVMLRWKKPVPFTGALKLFVMHRLANLLLPLRAGEGVRILAARKQFDINIPFLMAASINERILNIAFLVAMAFGLTFVIDDLKPFQIYLLMAGLIFVAAAAWILWRRRSELAAAAPNPSDFLSIENRFLRFWYKFSQGLAILKSPRVLLGVLLTSLGSWCALWLATIFLLQNIHAASPFLGAWSVLLFTNLASLLPLTPSNIGPFQWGCILSLSYFGIGRTEAVALSFVLQAVRIVSAGLLGLYAFVVDSGLINLNSTSRRVAETNQHLL